MGPVPGPAAARGIGPVPTRGSASESAAGHRSRSHRTARVALRTAAVRPRGIGPESARGIGPVPTRGIGPESARGIGRDPPSPRPSWKVGGGYG